MKSIIALILLLVLWSGSAFAERHALVVGINEYENIPKLTKAVGDAEAMSEALTSIGFTVTMVLNPDRRSFSQAVTTFRRALKPGDSAFVHFSGHGVEIDGRNLLLPRDIPSPEPGEEDFLVGEAIDLGEVIDRVSESGAAVRVFVIDACRDNPFQGRSGRGLDRSAGLALVQPPKGSFVLYSAGYQQTALDTLGPDDESRTSVYTRVLLEKITEPGITISQIARDVRTEVAALALSVGHDQSPAYYDELADEFVLSPLDESLARAADSAVEQAAFDRARDMNSPAAWEAFLKTYSEGVFADLARVALAALQPAPADAVVDRLAAREQIEFLWQEGEALANAGDDAGAYRSMRAAHDLATLHFGPDSIEYAHASNRLVGALTAVGQLDAAMESSREAIRVYTDRVGKDSIEVLGEMSNLASRMAATGNAREAESIFIDILATYDRVPALKGQERLYAHALEGYAQIKARYTGDLEGALALAAEAVSIMEGSMEGPSIDYGWILGNHAGILRQSRRCEEAKAEYRRAADAMAAAGVAEAHRDHAEFRQNAEAAC